jgi:hypothetical protein
LGRAAHGREHVLVEVVRGEDDHAASAARRGDAARGLDPVHLGHAHVHQDHIGHELFDELDRLGAVRGLARDLDVVASVEDHAEAAADERLVVGEDDGDAHGVASSGSRAWTR